MRREPAVDRDALVGAIGDAYGLAVRALRFRPVGYAAACYAVDCGREGRRFLKLWPDTIAGREAGARQVGALPLGRAARPLRCHPWNAPKGGIDPRWPTNSVGNHAGW